MRPPFAIDLASKLVFAHSSQDTAPMEKFITLEGVAAPLKIINVDTDMIIPLGLTLEKKASIDAYEAMLNERAWA
jgi:hypothetical protein